MRKIIVNSNGLGTQSKLLPILLYEKHPKLKEFWDNTIILNLFADTQDETDQIYHDKKEYEEYLAKNNYPPLITVSRGSMSKEYLENGIIPTRNFRHCTHKFKILQIRKYLREYLKNNGLTRKDVEIKMLIGFTTDEFRRVRDSDVKYIKNEFPFIYNLKYTRKDCIIELQNRGLQANKSGCWYCPFLSFKRFYDYVEDKPKEKNLILRMEKKALLKNNKMYLFEYPLKILIRNKESQTSLISYLDENQECNSGYCFI